VKVHCDVEETDLENEESDVVPGVIVTCERCGHATESFGTSPVSIRRCLAALREECPNAEENYYVIV
jgi:hypothetical protein